MGTGVIRVSNTPLSKSSILYLLTGPTGVGKTALALNWAQANNAEILSCDSLLFYKGMDIGTAKPSQKELMQIPHHGIDICPVDKQFNIKAYIDLAKQVVRSVEERGKKLLIVGGSGFYLKAFLAPVIDDIDVPDAINQEVLELYQQAGLQGLMSALLKLNPKGVGDLDVLNHRRVIKALIRCKASGKDLLDLKASFDSQETPFADYEKKICILHRNPEILKQRIRTRVFEMINAGLIGEVASLMHQGIEKNPSASTAIGYREIIAWLKNGSSDEAELAETIILNTNKLVAKQRKWFRTQIKSAQLINLDEHLHNQVFS